MFEAVVFDMDGVLFDTERISSECFFEAARELGLSVTEEAVYGGFGCNAADLKALFMRSMEAFYPGGAFPWESYIGRINELFNRRLLDGPPVMEGVKELLSFLRDRKIRLAVASSSGYERVMANLKHSGLTEYFQQIITGNMVEHSKPLPDIYLKACEALGVVPGRTMAVEDSPNGVRSARAAGMITVMVPDMLQPAPDIAALLDYRFDSLTALKDWLEVQPGI